MATTGRTHTLILILSLAYTTTLSGSLDWLSSTLSIASMIIFNDCSVIARVLVSYCWKTWNGVITDSWLCSVNVGEVNWDFIKWFSSSWSSSKIPSIVNSFLISKSRVFFLLISIEVLYKLDWCYDLNIWFTLWVSARELWMNYLLEESKDRPV